MKMVKINNRNNKSINIANNNFHRPSFVVLLHGDCNAAQDLFSLEIIRFD